MFLDDLTAWMEALQGKWHHESIRHLHALLGLNGMLSRKEQTGQEVLGRTNSTTFNT
jgi:hypothetical protein